ncbi:MAG: multiheme c-type cytochrome [bacterium]
MNSLKNDDIAQLMVDGGDFGSSKSKSQILKVEYLLKGMSLLKYDAITLGEKDLQYGVAFLEEMRDKFHLPFISANIYDIAKDKLFAEPYIIKTVKGRKFGIFGVTLAQGVGRTVTPATGFRIEDPISAAQASVKELREKCDVVIALTHLSINGAISLAEKIEGIDIVVSGHNGSHLRNPHKVGKSYVLQPGSKGKYLGQFDFTLSGGRITQAEGKTVALSDKYQDDEELANVVKQYDDEVLLAFPLESPKAKTGYSLMSEKTCRGCHYNQHKQWRSTPHAHAWETLVQKKQAHNPDCQQCHTTLFGQSSGFSSLKDSPDLVSVQCVTCHQLVSTRVKTHFERFRGKKKASNVSSNGEAVDFAAISEKTCLQCHNEDNSPNFDYQTFLAKIAH